jgi:hypothetical protein
MRTLALVAAVSSTLALAACQKAQYVDPKGNDLVVSLDKMNIQDWNQLADQVVQQMVTSGALARMQNQPARLLLNRPINKTSESFDTDAIMKKIRISLLNTGKAEIIMTSGPGGRAEDPIARDAANARAFASGTDNQLNEKRLPDATLTAKLLEDRSRSGSTRQVAYILQMSLTDTNRETAVWEGEAQVVKQGTKSGVGF